MQIIHCSDFHICKPINLSAIRGKRFFGWLNWVLNRRKIHHSIYLNKFKEKMQNLKPDVVCITGDLAQLGTKKELEIAECYLNELSNYTGNLLYVPGNHDKYIEDKESELIRNRIIAKYGNCNEKISKTIGDLDFVLIDQTIFNKLFRFAGKISNELYAKLNSLTLKNANRIILGHFPIIDSNGRELAKKRQLIDAEKLIAHLSSAKNSLYLCGHIHHPFATDLGINSIQLCAGSLTTTGSYYNIKVTDNKFDYKLESVN